MKYGRPILKLLLITNLTFRILPRSYRENKLIAQFLFYSGELDERISLAFEFAELACNNI